MKEQGTSVAVVTLVAVAVSFAACNRVQGMKSAQAVTGVVAQPAPQKPQPSAAAQTAPARPRSTPASSASPSPPLAASKSDVRPPKVVVSDRSQTLIVAQQTFRLLTHVQSIAGTTDETGHFLLLIRSNSSARPASAAPPKEEDLVWMVIARIALPDILVVPPSSPTPNHSNKNMVV